MLLIFIHYGETNWVFLAVKIQYLMVAWTLHIECTGPGNDIHLSCTQKGDTTFSLDHTELLHPTMFDAPSVAKPMQFAGLWPHLFVSSSIKSNIFSPVASCTRIKPINPVTISFLLSLKNRTNIHKCFCVELSIDSSVMMAYFFF